MLTVLAVVCVFLVRLVNIQVVQAEELNAQSYDKRAVPLPLYGTRGDIVDANGEVLALSVDRFDITASPRVALGLGEPQRPGAGCADQSAALTGGDPAHCSPSSRPIPTPTSRTSPKSKTLEVYRQVMDLGIGWVYSDYDPSRTYPNGAVAGNLVGFIGTRRSAAPASRSVEDECLGSTDGEAVYERGENGVAHAGQHRDPPSSRRTAARSTSRSTATCSGTCSSGWPRRLVRPLGASWVTAVVIRVSDGHLIGGGRLPVSRPEQRRRGRPRRHGLARVQAPYEPGSIMKPLLDRRAHRQQARANPTTPAHRARPPVPDADGAYIKDSFAHDDINYT